MERQDVKVMIGDFREIENEKLLEEIIENYEDNDASYKEAYLILQNDDDGNKSGDVFAVLDYETSFTVIDVYGNAQTYDEDDVSEQYAEIDIQRFDDYFEDYYDDCGCYDKFYTLFKPLWKDIYNTIIEYRLDEEKFLSCFKNDDSNSVNYEIVQFFQYCLEFDHVNDFINEIYKSN